MTYRREERETTAVYSAETNTWQIYTCEPKHRRRLERLFGPPEWSDRDGAASWRALHPKAVLFRQKAKSRPFSGIDAAHPAAATVEARPSPESPTTGHSQEKAGP